MYVFRAIFIFALPYFLYPSSNRLPDDFGLRSNTTFSTIDDERTYLCHKNDYDDHKEEICENLNKMQTFNFGALAIFLTSEMLQGMGNSPKYSLSLTYIDDNSKNNSPKYYCRYCSLCIIILYYLYILQKVKYVLFIYY